MVHDVQDLVELVDFLEDRTDDPDQHLVAGVEAFRRGQKRRVVRSGGRREVGIDVLLEFGHALVPFRLPIMQDARELGGDRSSRPRLSLRERSAKGRVILFGISRMPDGIDHLVIGAELGDRALGFLSLIHSGRRRRQNERQRAERNDMPAIATCSSATLVS